MLHYVALLRAVGRQVRGWRLEYPASFYEGFRAPGSQSSSGTPKLLSAHETMLY